MACNLQNEAFAVFQRAHQPSVNTEVRVWRVPVLFCVSENGVSGFGVPILIEVTKSKSITKSYKINDLAL